MTEEPRATLLNCPFCNSEAEIRGVTCTEIRCTNDQCISSGAYNDFGHRLQAIAAWNRRATPAVRDGLVERLRKAADDFEGCRYSHGNSEDSDCEPHWSCQKDMADASKTALEAAAALSLRPAETRVKELEDALRDCQKTLAMLIDPANFDASISHAWAVCVASEAKVRAALASISEPARAEEGKEPVAWQPDLDKALDALADVMVEAAEDEDVQEFIERDLERMKQMEAAPSSTTLEITEEAVEAAAKALIDADPTMQGHHKSHVAAKRPAARAALETSLPFLSQTGGWRDISTAPKSLSARLLLWPDQNGRSFEGYWNDGSSSWSRVKDTDYSPQSPRLWMPMPLPAPSNEAGE